MQVGLGQARLKVATFDKSDWFTDVPQAPRIVPGTSSILLHKSMTRNGRRVNDRMGRF